MLKPVNNDDSRYYLLKSEHKHRPDVRKFGSKEVLTKVKNLAKTTTLEPNQIIMESMVNVQKATAASLPKPNTLRRQINRIRSDSEIPANPKELKDLVLTAGFCTTENGHQFLLYDSGQANATKRILMFGTNDNLNFLKQCSEIYMDGTFSVAPPLFAQLYTIHGQLIEFVYLLLNIILVICFLLKSSIRIHKSRITLSIKINIIII